MPGCSRLAACPFYNEHTAHAAEAAEAKLRYCLRDSTLCARSMIIERLGETMVPDDLHPDEHSRAAAILAGS